MWMLRLCACEMQVKDYYDVIETPMALATICEKLKSCDYEAFSDCLLDFELIVNNCIKYNGTLPWRQCPR